MLSRIRGAERKASLKLLLDSGRPEDLPDFLAKSALTRSERQALGRIHPAFMGGEYLPDLSATETMIARITIASTTQDVTCVYARARQGPYLLSRRRRVRRRDALGQERAYIEPTTESG